MATTAVAATGALAVVEVVDFVGGMVVVVEGGGGGGSSHVVGDGVGSATARGDGESSWPRTGPVTGRVRAFTAQGRRPSS